MSLPEEIWARVFSLMPLQDRLSTVPLVCKGWDRVVRDYGSVIWQNCSIDNSHSSRSERPLLDYFKVVQCFAENGKLVKSLSVAHPVQQGAAEGMGWQFFRNGLTALLALTPHLEVLDCYNLKEFFVPEESIFTLKRFLSLRSLRLSMRSNGSWQEATLHPLSHLSCLTNLDITVSNMGSEPLLLAQGLSNLTGLTSLSFSRSRQSMRECYPTDHAVAMPNLATVIPSLTRLETLHLSGVIDSIPDSFSSLRALRELAADGFDNKGPAFSISSAFVAGSPLQVLRLHELSEASGPALPQICSSICQLTSLRRLEIRKSHLLGVDAAACSFSPYLIELVLSCGMEALPPCILSMTSLETLLFHSEDSMCRYAYVPPIGPYLENLRDLQLWAVPEDVSTEFLLAAGNLEFLLLLSDEDDGDITDEGIQMVEDHCPAACCVMIERWGPSWPP